MWNTIAKFYPFPVNSNLTFIDWIDYIWKCEKVYKKLYYRSLKKNVIVWSI